VKTITNLLSYSPAYRARLKEFKGAGIIEEYKTIGKFSCCPKAVSGLEKSELGIGKKLLEFLALIGAELLFRCLNRANACKP
jgi:hypothetical protein